MKKNALFLALIVFVLSSCLEKGDSISNKSLSIDRKEFISTSFSLSLLQESYRGLSFENQRDLWVDKLVKTITSDFGRKNRRVLDGIINILKKVGSREDLVQSKELKDLAIFAAKSFPSESFLNIFCTLNDFDELNQKNEIIIESLASQIEDDFNLLTFIEEFEKNGNLPPCNCKWTCAMFELVAFTHDRCQPTSTGCGFLWLFDCTKRDEIHKKDCPPV